MISNFSQIQALFEEIDEVMEKKAKAYVIGGTVLLQQGLKPATKDIDLVAANRTDFLEIEKALTRIGFSQHTPGKEYKRMNLSKLFQRENFRIDLFEKQVCGGFSLSNGMIRRARKLKHLTVSLCSNEDVFLFKTMTEREGDLKDCESLIGSGINWKIILNELIDQINQSSKDVWVTWVGERLDLLEDRGLEIPIMREVNKLRLKFFDGLEKNNAYFTL